MYQKSTVGNSRLNIITQHLAQITYVILNSIATLTVSGNITSRMKTPNRITEFILRILRRRRGVWRGRPKGFRIGVF